MTANPGLTSIVGPLSASAANHVQNMANQMHVPHIETRYDFWLPYMLHYNLLLILNHGFWAQYSSLYGHWNTLEKEKIDSFSPGSITSPFLKFQVWLRSPNSRLFNQCSSASICFGKSLCGFNQSPWLEIFGYSFSNRGQFGQVARSPQIAANIWRYQNYFEATWFDHRWLQTIAEGDFKICKIIF